MASHSYIFSLENNIIAARQSIDIALDAFRDEGKDYPENRDVWAQFHHNAMLLESSLKELLKVTKKEFPT